MQTERKLIGYVITAGHLDIEWYQALRSYRFWTAEAFEDLKAAASRDDFGVYVLDGQVFPLEEYLEIAPENEAAMRALAGSGKLSIGPFYTQFDEWLPSAENMIRNCLYGRIKAKGFGGYMRAGYLPDNFGHPRQLPQILNNFGIDSLLFMRGMPEVAGGHPDEFIYEGIDGSRVFACHFRSSYSGAFDIFRKGNDPKQPRETPYFKDYISYEYHREIAVHDDPERIAKNLINNARNSAARFPSGVIPLIAGADHLPPQINAGESVKAANEMQDEILFVMGTAEGYVREAQKRMDNPAVYDMELTGSRYHHILLGALSTRSYLKRDNFAGEALVERYAEPLTAIASIAGYADRPLLLDEAWKYLMINSAHDSIHGSSLDDVHVEMQFRGAAAKQIASGIIHEALAYIGRLVKSRRRDGRLKIWDALSYAPARAAFMQPAEVWLATGGQPVVFTDEMGNELPTQTLEREPVLTNGAGMPRNDMHPAPVFRKVLFMSRFAAGRIALFSARPAEPAEAVATAVCCGAGAPTTASGNYTAIPAATADYDADVPASPSGFNKNDSISASDRHLENEFLRIDFDGALMHLTDKTTGRIYYNLNLIEDEADAGDAWDYSQPWTPSETARSASFTFTSKLMEHGAVRSTVEICGGIDVPARLEGDRRSAGRVFIPLTLYVTLYRGTRRADVRLIIENMARDHRMRLCVPTGIKTDRVLSQGHLAVIDRPVGRPSASECWVQPQTQLYPCREWVAARDESNGLAIVFKGLYDYEAINNPLTGEPTLCMTLVRGIQLMGRRNTMQRRGPASDACDTPGAQCLGTHEIEWAYAPYTPDGNDAAPFLPEAQSFLYPPVVHFIRSEPGAKAAEMEIPAAAAVTPPASGLPLWQGFDWGAANVQFSAFKKAADGDGYALRFYENQGKPVIVKIPVMPFVRAVMSNMNEDTLEELPVEDNALSVRVGAYKAVTIKLYI